MLTCGVVILNYVDYAMTERLINHIRDCTEIDRIVVVDNNSPNDSYTHLKKYESPKISVIQSGKNGGYSVGNNVGAKHLIDKFHPDIVCIANPDVLFDDKLVKRIKEVFAANPDYALLTGLQTDAAGNAGIGAFWPEYGTPSSICLPMVWNIFLKPFSFLINKPSRYSLYVSSVQNSPKIPCEVWAVEGSLFFIRTEDFVKIGMFDEEVFLYCEENILAFKLHKLGRKIGVVNDTSFFHEHASPDPDKDRQLDSELRHVRLSGRSLKHYFSHYVTDSRILHAVFSCLLVLRRIYVEVRCFLSKSIYHAKKYFTTSNSSL